MTSEPWIGEMPADERAEALCCRTGREGPSMNQASAAILDAEQRAVAARDAEIERLRARIRELEALMKDWEAWEASIILDARCWAPGGMAPLPRLQQDHLDALTPLQERRNAALAKATPDAR